MATKQNKNSHYCDLTMFFFSYYYIGKIISGPILSSMYGRWDWVKFRYLYILMKFPLRHFFSRLNISQSLSLSSQERFSSPLIIFVVFHWTLYSMSMSFLYQGPRTCHSTPCLSWLFLNRKERSPPLTYRKHYPMQPRYFNSKGILMAHVQLSIYQDSKVLFCKAAFKLCGPQHALVPGIVLPSADFWSSS